MTLAKLHKQLTTNGVIKSSRPYLSKLVTNGVIPYTEEDGKRRYNYDEVVQALKNNVQKTTNELHPPSKDFPPLKEGQSKGEYEEEVRATLGENPSLADSKTFLTIYQGKIAEQKFDIEAKKLVYREEVEQKAFIVARVIRDQMLTLPERLSGELASSTDPKEIKEIMYKEINNVLLFLHEGDALYD